MVVSFLQCMEVTENFNLHNKQNIRSQRFIFILNLTHIPILHMVFFIITKLLCKLCFSSCHWCQYIEEHSIFHPPILDQTGKIFHIFILPYGFGWSLYKSAIFQLSALSRSGLAFLDKHTNFHIYWVHHFLFQFWLQDTVNSV
jgi:hypothetical protein